jgi:hypothetical protein
MSSQNAFRLGLAQGDDPERNLSEPRELTHAARPSRGCFDALYHLRSGLAGANAGTSLDADCAPIPRIAASSIAIPTSKSLHRDSNRACPDKRSGPEQAGPTCPVHAQPGRGCCWHPSSGKRRPRVLGYQACQDWNWSRPRSPPHRRPCPHYRTGSKRRHHGLNQLVQVVGLPVNTG